MVPLLWVQPAPRQRAARLIPISAGSVWAM